MNKIKILVLGADGFIGSNLIKRLIQRKDVDLVAFDLFTDGKIRNLDFSENLEFFSGNFLNRDDIQRALEGVNYVFHCISLTTPGSSMNDPVMDVDTNIKGTIILLEECVRAGVGRIIYASSGGAIYGDQGKEIYSETDSVLPISPYAISKATIEHYLRYFKRHYGLDSLVLRYSNPYGPGQNVVGSQGIIPIFLHLVSEKKPIVVFGDGTNVRDYIYIDDLINITEKLFDRKTLFDVYNVGSGIGVTINDVVSTIKKVTKEPVTVNYLPSRDADVKRVVLDLSRLESETYLESATSLENGIMRTWNWLLNK